MVAQKLKTLWVVSIGTGLGVAPTLRQAIANAYREANK